MLETADGLKWETGEGGPDRMGLSHEDSITPLVLGLLPPGGVFLDVGAHVGHYALRAARTASRVIAVEPNPATAERLRYHAFINGLDNISVVEVAAWNGTCRMSVRRVHEIYERDGSGRVEPDDHGAVSGVRLDDALNQYPLRPDRLDVIKLDVEGADIQALDGMRGLIGRHRPVLFVEDHSYLGYYHQDDLFHALDDLGYPGWEQVDWCGAVYWLCRPSASSAGTQ